MNQISSYITATVNLYGVVSTEKIIEIYNQQNEEQISTKSLEHFINKTPSYYIRAEGNLFYHEVLDSESLTPLEFQVEKESLPYYVPQKEILLNYADEYYFEKSEEYHNLESFLAEHFFQGNNNIAEEVATEVHDMLSLNNSTIEDAYSIFNLYGIILENDVRFNQLMELVTDYLINIPHWSYNGYSLLESTEKMREKFGLNDKYEVKLTLLEKYIVALVNLYGRVTKEKVLEIYNLQNDDQINLSEVKKYIDNPPTFFENYFVEIAFGEFLACDLLMFKEDYSTLVKEQTGKLYYIPEKEELLNYAEPHYSEQPLEYIELVEFLKSRQYKNQSNNIENIVEMIFIGFMMGVSVEIALDHIEIEKFRLRNKTQLNKLLVILQNFRDNTRMRKNNGYTPIELENIMNRE